MKTTVATVAGSLLLGLLTLGSPAHAAPVCYQLPFGNPNLADGWGSTCCGRTNPHRGVDFPQPMNKPIPAAADGVVRRNEWSGCLGNILVLEHADGMYSGYAHMVTASPLPIGTVVKRGDTIGNVGSTGTCTTGPHLHLSMSPGVDGVKSGTTVDPYAYIQSHLTCCDPSAAEVCDGQDNDCDGAVDEDDVCDVARLLASPVLYAAPRTTDLDGDGKADVCARSSAGIECHMSTADGFDEGGVLVPIAATSGWGDASNHGTLRMGDIDGDGKADLCARADAGVVCWTSETTPLGTSVTGPAWSDAGNWNQPFYYTTIRLVDIDGDGKDDLCARASGGIVCHRSTGKGFGPQINGPAWADASGFTFARYYGTLLTGDVNGDGKGDLCIRGGAGVSCALSDGAGFPETISGPAWADENGWTNPMYYGSIRLADVNGDGKADLCARAAKGVICHFSTGTGFGDEILVAPASDAAGWNDPGNYLTLRTGDIDGDGAEDFCARSNTTVACWRWDGKAFVGVVGPSMADENGWNHPQYYETFRLADIDGDRRADLCARSAAGWTCARSKGDGFEPFTAGKYYADANGWGTAPYFSGLMIGSSACLPSAEKCDGEDNDCDGKVDEDGVCDPPAGSGGAAGKGGSGAGATGGSFPVGGSGQGGGGGVPSGRSGQGSKGGGTFTVEPLSQDDAGCAMATSPRGAGVGAWLLVAAAVVARRRRALDRAPEGPQNDEAHVAVGLSSRSPSPRSWRGAGGEGITCRCPAWRRP